MLAIASLHQLVLPFENSHAGEARRLYKHENIHLSKQKKTPNFRYISKSSDLPFFLKASQSTKKHQHRPQRAKQRGRASRSYLKYSQLEQAIFGVQS